MCGIAGILSINKSDVSGERIKAMTDTIAHRGPDGAGAWINESGNLGLGHRRLSIIDLSIEGAQPMHFADRYSIVFNGEIYNYIELKEQCVKQGYQFRTQTDTEVLLAMYDWKKTSCLELLDGMFAFAIYDNQTKALFCARDRFGEKPFYYAYEPGKHFVFASEMKALWAGGIERKINNRQVFSYLNFGYTDNPFDISETFFEGCKSLPHAHYLVVDSVSCKIVKQQRYYNINRAPHAEASEGSILAEFKELLIRSVERRLRSDVALGSSLSGGLDSSVIVSIIERFNNISEKGQHSFSAVFPGYEKDERKYIDSIVAATHITPHFVEPDAAGFFSDLEKLCYHQEQPVGSASIYAQYCVMKLAKQNNVTVLLDGQGADEVLGGYPGYFRPFFIHLKQTNKQQYNEQLNSFNKLFNGSAAAIFNPASFHFHVQAYASQLMGGLRKLKHVFADTGNAEINRDFVKAFDKSKAVYNSETTELNEQLYNDSTVTGGLQQLLRYADRNSMAHGREVRLPFLSHELVDFSFSLPSRYKIHNGWTKWMLRTSFSEMLPKEICWRVNKIGFAAPQENWMKTAEMTGYASTVKEQLVREGILDKRKVKKHSNPLTDWRYIQTMQLLKK